MNASGAFEITMLPQQDQDFESGRLTIDKQYKGDLEGTGKGQMLSAHGHIEGSAAYVAIEKVEGSLHGKQGAFALQHRGVMDRGSPSLEVGIIPDSGTGELSGISGTMNIIIQDGQHFYELHYRIETAAE